MTVKNKIYILIGSIILIYLLFFSGIPESELYGIYTNNYKNHRDTIWLYTEGKGEQKIYDKKNLLVYSHKFEWSYNYIIPRSCSSLSMSITLPDDVNYTDSLYRPSEQFRFEPTYYHGLSFDKHNDTIIIFTNCYTEIETKLYYRSMYKIPN